MAEEVNKSYYSILPANVRYDDDLIPNAKLLYSEITSLCNETGYCWASNDYFANLYKVSKKTISIWINTLRAKGYISSEIIYKQGTKEVEKRYLRIYVNPMEEKRDTPIPKKVDTPIPKKVIDNTKVLNTKLNNTIVEIIDYFNATCGTNYKPATKATVKLISSRLEEKFEVEDFKKVIFVMNNKWKADPKMKEYIRPATLFNEDKFEGYLQQYKGGLNNGESIPAGSRIVGTVQPAIIEEDDVTRALRKSGRTIADIKPTDDYEF